MTTLWLAVAPPLLEARRVLGHENYKAVNRPNPLDKHQTQVLAPTEKHPLNRQNNSSGDAHTLTLEPAWQREFVQMELRLLIS